MMGLHLGWEVPAASGLMYPCSMYISCAVTAVRLIGAAQHASMHDIDKLRRLGSSSFKVVVLFWVLIKAENQLSCACTAAVQSLAQVQVVYGMLAPLPPGACGLMSMSK